jgi:hypothetical protein
LADRLIPGADLPICRFADQDLSLILLIHFDD